MSISKIESVKKNTLSFTVYDNIKKSIIKGEISPNTRLTVGEISKQLNVSATPVREAFRRLASEGFIKTTPYHGAVVQEFSEQEISESYECREALELKAVELAIDKIDSDGLKKLKELLKQSSEIESYSDYVEINSEIHNLIINISGNKILKKLMKNIREITMRDRTISSFNKKRRKEIYLEHKNIIDAIEKKDKTRAMNAMRIHVQNGYNYIKKDRYSNLNIEER